MEGKSIDAEAGEFKQVVDYWGYKNEELGRVNPDEECTKKLYGNPCSCKPSKNRMGDHRISVTYIGKRSLPISHPIDG